MVWYVRKLEDSEAAEQYCAEIGRSDAYVQLIFFFCLLIFALSVLCAPNTSISVIRLDLSAFFNIALCL